MTPRGGDRHEWLGGISLPGSGKHWRAMVNTLQLETCRRLAQKGPSGCPAHLGAPQTSTCPGLMHGDPGIHNCRELPGASITTNFRLGVMLKPNLSPVPFSDEESKAKVVRAWLSPLSYMGHSPVSPGLFLQLAPLVLSTEALEQHGRRMTPQNFWDRMDIVALPSPANSKANGPTALPCRILPALAVHVTWSPWIPPSELRPCWGLQEGTVALAPEKW